MMSGVPLEICWAFNKLWNNKFYYKLHLIGILLSHTAMHGSMNNKSSFYFLYSFRNSIQISCHKPETDVCYVVVTIRCDDHACYVPTRSVLHLFMYQFISFCCIFVRSVTSHLTWPVHIYHRDVSRTVFFFQFTQQYAARSHKPLPWPHSAW
jgi:hypothetical protein